MADKFDAVVQQLLDALTTEQKAKLADWIAGQDLHVRRLQEEANLTLAVEQGPQYAAFFGVLLPPGDKPNYGTTGGGYTYELTPTSLGTAVSVRNDVTKESIDLTSYDEW